MEIKSIAFQVLLSVSSTLVIIIVLFSDFLPFFWGSYDGQRFVQVYTSGLLTIASVTFLLWQRKFFTRSTIISLLPGILLPFAFLLLALPFFRQSYVWVEPGMYYFFFLSLVTAGWAVSASGSQFTYCQFLVYLVAIACFLYGAVSFEIYLFSLFDRVDDLINYIPWGFANIRYWGHIATWFIPLVPLAVLLGPWKDSRLWQVLVACGAVFWWWIIFLSYSRGSLLGIVFGVFIAALFLGRRSWPWLKVSLFYFMAGAVLWVLLSLVIPSFWADGAEIPSLRTGGSGRIPMFFEAWKMSLQNFPFGLGPQSWLTHEYFTETYANSRSLGHPHNMYLMWAAEYGWFLIVMMMILIAQLIRYFLKYRAALLMSQDFGSILMLAGYTASISAALFHAGVSAVFIAPGSLLVGSFVLVGFWSLILPQRERCVPKGQKITSGKKQVITNAALLGIVLLVWILWAKNVLGYYRDMREDKLHYQESVQEPSFPRFWLHGNFPRR